MKNNKHIIADCLVQGRLLFDLLCWCLLAIIEYSMNWESRSQPTRINQWYCFHGSVHFEVTGWKQVCWTIWGKSKTLFGGSKAGYFPIMMGYEWRGCLHPFNPKPSRLPGIWFTIYDDWGYWQSDRIMFQAQGHPRIASDPGSQHIGRLKKFCLLWKFLGTYYWHWLWYLTATISLGCSFQVRKWIKTSFHRPFVGWKNR